MEFLNSQLNDSYINMWFCLRCITVLVAFQFPLPHAAKPCDVRKLTVLFVYAAICFNFLYRWMRPRPYSLAHLTKFFFYFHFVDAHTQPLNFWRLNRTRHRPASSQTATRRKIPMSIHIRAHKWIHRVLLVYLVFIWLLAWKMLTRIHNILFLIVIAILIID